MGQLSLVEGFSLTLMAWDRYSPSLSVRFSSILLHASILLIIKFLYFLMQLTLKPNEYITLLSGIHAKYYNNPAIASLKIHTNISPSGYGPYGLAKNVSEPFNFLTPFLPEDHRIVEFFGREDGPNLQSLGVRIAMVSSIQLCSLMINILVLCNYFFCCFN